MILSIHLVEAGARERLRLLRAVPRPGDVPGLRWATTTLAFPLGAGPAGMDAAGLIAAFDDESALDAFAAEDPLARRFDGGWHARLEPLRAVGAFAPLPGIGEPELPADPDEPVAVLTIGRTRLRRLPSFLRASAPAERQAAGDSAALLSTAMARPPRLVSTFSVWRTCAEMRAYATAAGEAHMRAMRVNAAHPFHHEQLFARFRPTGAQGAFRGSSALAPDAAVPA